MQIHKIFWNYFVESDVFSFQISKFTTVKEVILQVLI